MPDHSLPDPYHSFRVYNPESEIETIVYALSIGDGFLALPYALSVNDPMLIMTFIFLIDDDTTPLIDDDGTPLIEDVF